MSIILQLFLFLRSVPIKIFRNYFDILVWDNFGDSYNWKSLVVFKIIKVEKKLAVPMGN